MTVDKEVFIILFSSDKEQQDYKMFDSVDKAIKYIYNHKKMWVAAAKLTINQVPDFVKHHYEDYTSVWKEYCADNDIKLITREVAEELKKYAFNAKH